MRSRISISYKNTRFMNACCGDAMSDVLLGGGFEFATHDAVPYAVIVIQSQYTPFPHPLGPGPPGLV